MVVAARIMATHEVLESVVGLSVFFTRVMSFGSLFKLSLSSDNLD